MKREQIWCDSCGREIQVKNTPKGYQDFNNSDKSWELWSPNENDDHVCCSLKCVIETAKALILRESAIVEHDETFEKNVISCENN